ncbi:ATP-binding cassette domain-containing protein [Pseudactinotalea sp. HY160]|uniref:ABC transporter ATP-binding protein n=1 Tax=Pseudactinotalea sp. HY160 TaxID=2654490 RepID=UPI00128D2B03|nr:ABC transporter ATP-binding protein [Pseudactinotalea sp. HY160]MPV50166.1 ATP-binding cassette domain-containing protein [Pseudactinotalea sp. HY160]
MTEPVLVVDDLHKSFRSVEAVAGIGFHIDPGETYGLLGPNGAGKTTTISMIAGLLAADSGSITIAGEPMTPTAIHVRSHLGLVPQDLAIYPDLSARENLAFFGRLQGLHGHRLRARVTELLEVVGLSDRAKSRTKEFSGGMKRRLNIAIGLLHEPALLILDEPTVGVDPQSRNAIVDSVARLAGEGMAVLYTTHYMEEAHRLCDRIAIVDDGAIRAEGTAGDLIGLMGGVDEVRLTGTGDVAAAAAALEALPGVSGVVATGEELEVHVSDGPHAIAGLVTAAGAAGLSLSDVEVTRPTLEAVFLHLTGKGLRD